MTPQLIDINGPEFMLLLALAVILFGPERLPDLARKAARVLRYVRTMPKSWSTATAGSASTPYSNA